MSSKANVNETLTAADIARITADLSSAAKASKLFTVGFTIKNCAKLIGESLSDPGVLGLFVHMPAAPEVIKETDKAPEIILSKQVSEVDAQQSTPPQELVLSHLVIRREAGVPRLGTVLLSGEGKDYRTEFKVFAQTPEPSFPADVSNVQENQLLDLTNGTLHPAPAARASDLSQVTNWAKACFFRRSDLKFMQLLLLAQAGQQNDLFFSGAKVRFDIMHNPRLRMEQFTRKDANGIAIPDSGRAFTMKAEPIINPDEKVPTGNEMIELLGGTTSTNFSQRGTTSGEEMFPGAVMATPCPPFWDIIQDIGANLNINSTEGAKRVMELLGKIDDIVANPGPNGTKLSLSAIVNAEKRHWSYGFLTFLINVLTQLRDGSNS